jgi:hypothetical protein
MSARVATWLAWSSWSLSVALVPTGLAFGILALSASLPPGRGPILPQIAVVDVLLLAYGSVGVRSPPDALRTGLVGSSAPLASRSRLPPPPPATPITVSTGKAALGPLRSSRPGSAYGSTSLCCSSPHAFYSCSSPTATRRLGVGVPWSGSWLSPAPGSFLRSPSRQESSTNHPRTP